MRSQPSARRSCCASSTSEGAAPAPRSPSSLPPMRRPAGRWRSPTPTASSPATTAPGCGSACRRSPAAARRSRPASRRSAAHRGFELLEDDPGLIAERAARKALTLLDAGPAPSGSMPVVVGGGFGGVLFHEMTGHGLEADHIQKGASVYAGKLGERVAQPLLERLRRRPPAGRVGERRDRRRGGADAEDAG